MSRVPIPSSELPLKHLAKAVNNRVLVKLKDGSEYIGVLELCDSCMNLVLTDASEIREDTQQPITKYGRILIRGSFILFVALDATKVSLH
ncbi:MAG: Sm ribonucleo [Thermoprotei archaeon]|nr:MAG: Sm ribonucleo [Thermoprotei archaeon]